MATKRATTLGTSLLESLREIYGDAREIPDEVAQFATKQAETLAMVLGHKSFPDAAKAAAQAVALYAGVSITDAADISDQRALSAIFTGMRVGIALL